MAFWNPLPYKRKSLLRTFGDGLNTAAPALDIGESELTDSLNMCSDDYPAIRTRNDRAILDRPATSQENAFGTREDVYLHVLDGKHWLYTDALGSTAWTQLSSAMGSTLATGDGKFVEYNTEAYRYTILAQTKVGTTDIPKAYDGSTTLVSLTSNAPNTPLYASHKFRVWGVDINYRTLRYCALGNLTDWITSLDAGSIDMTNAKSDISALVEFNDKLIVFTRQSMYEVYGDRPTNFSLINISENIGCINNRAWVERKGILYFMDSNGIYSYNGIIRKISDKVRKYIDGINAFNFAVSSGVSGDKIYFNIAYNSASQNTILVYDTVKEKWSIETGRFPYFASCYGGILFAISSTNGLIYKMNTTAMTGYDTYSTLASASSAISWSMETKAFNDYNLDSQTAVDDMWISHEGTTLATMSIGMTSNANSTVFTTLLNSSDFTHSTQPTKEQLVMRTTDFANVDYYKLQISGTGHKKINGLQVDTMLWGGGK